MKKNFTKKNFDQLVPSRANSVLTMILALISSWIATSPSVFAGGTVELVQSVPLETTLEVPGIQHTQAAWIELIGSAKRSIDLEGFYVTSKPGRALDPVLAEIRAAAARGVKVRLLVDSKFYVNYSQDPLSLSRSPNVEVRTIDLGAGVQHAKYFVVDHSRAYVGSANFDWLALSHIHEIGLKLDDPDVAQNLAAIFSQDWQLGISVGHERDAVAIESPSLSAASKDSRSVRVLASPASMVPAAVADTLGGILNLLGSAKNTIRIQVYQYTTRDPHSPGGHWGELDAAIRGAAERGVKVQLLVDSYSLKSGQADLKALSQLKNMEVRIVKIPTWSGGHLDFARLIHSKYLTVDGEVSWVGSENWSQNYFTTSRNVGVLVHSRDIAQQLEQVFHQIWISEYSAPVNLD